MKICFSKFLSNPMFRLKQKKRQQNKENAMKNVQTQTFLKVKSHSVDII